MGQVAHKGPVYLIMSGSCLSPWMISDLLGWRLILSSDMTRANMVRESIWLVYAFVDATPISGPALMWIPQWDSRQIVEPTWEFLVVSHLMSKTKTHRVGDSNDEGSPGFAVPKKDESYAEPCFGSLENYLRAPRVSAVSPD